MSEEIQGEAVEQSTVLNEEEVTAAVKGEEGEVIVEDTVLPSDVEKFEMPTKFEGKSAEEIAKAYQELEKMKTEPTGEEGGDEVSEDPEPKEEGTGIDYSKYYDNYLENGEVSEADYAELAEQGLSKDQVDERVEFIKYKADKAEAVILDGTSPEEYSVAAVKAREVWGDEKAKEYNKELAEATPFAQKILIKNLMKEFGGDVKASTEPLHTSTPQSQPSKGYKNRSELLADISDPRYESDRTFNEAVQKKLAISDDSGW